MLHQLKYLDLSNLKNQISEWISLYDQTDSDKKIVFISYGCLGEFKHEVRQFEKSYDNQQAEQISLMV